MTPMTPEQLRSHVAERHTDVVTLAALVSDQGLKKRLSFATSDLLVAAGALDRGELSLADAELHAAEVKLAAAKAIVDTHGPDAVLLG